MVDKFTIWVQVASIAFKWLMAKIRSDGGLRITAKVNGYVFLFTLQRAKKTK